MYHRDTGTYGYRPSEGRYYHIVAQYVDVWEKDGHGHQAGDIDRHGWHTRAICGANVYSCAEPRIHLEAPDGVEVCPRCAKIRAKRAARKMQPGDRATIYNRTLGGRVVVEGVATLVAKVRDYRPEPGVEEWSVRFDGESDCFTRIVRPCDVHDGDPKGPQSLWNRRRAPSGCLTPRRD